MSIGGQIRKKLMTLTVIIAIVVFAIMYGIGHHFANGSWDLPSPRPQGIIATADYGFQKIFFGDKYFNGDYMYGTSLISGTPDRSTKSSATINVSGPNDSSVVALASPTANIGEPSDAIASPPMIAENTKFGQIGQCKLTSVAKVSTRLENTPGSGSAINYSDGTFGVSYDAVPGVDDSRQGDRVKLCLASIPRNCHAGEDDGSVYSAENLRTKESWSLPNSSHECEGA